MPDQLSQNFEKAPEANTRVLMARWKIAFFGMVSAACVVLYAVLQILPIIYFSKPTTTSNEPAAIDVLKINPLPGETQDVAFNKVPIENADIRRSDNTQLKWLARWIKTNGNRMYIFDDRTQNGDANAIFSTFKLVDEASGTQSLSPINNLGWQIYRNDEYGFAMQYPPGWLVKENPIHSRSYNNSNGIEVIFYTTSTPTTMHYSYAIPLPNYANTNDVLWISYDSSPGTPLDAIYTKLFSTLRFMEAATATQATSLQSVDTESWITYKNERLGLEVRYPPTWKFYRYNVDSQTSNGIVDDGKEPTSTLAYFSFGESFIDESTNRPQASISTIPSPSVLFSLQSFSSGYNTLTQPNVAIGGKQGFFDAKSYNDNGAVSVAPGCGVLCGNVPWLPSGLQWVYAAWFTYLLFGISLAMGIIVAKHLHGFLRAISIGWVAVVALMFISALLPLLFGSIGL